MKGSLLILALALPASAQTVLQVDTSGNVTANGYGAFLSLSTSGTQFMVNGMIGAEPGSPPASGRGILWFDDGSDWPLIAPMGLNSSGNASTMVRVVKGSSVGTYTPNLWGVGGNYTPGSTFEIYDSTPTPALGAMTCTGTGCALHATLSGTYTGSAQDIYCIVIDTGGATNPNTYKWSANNCVSYVQTLVPIACSTAQSLNNGVMVTWSGGNCPTNPTGGRRSRKGGETRAGVAAVQVQAELGGPLAQLAPAWAEQDFDIGIAFEYRAEAVFHDYGDAQVRARALQDLERGRSKHAVAQ
jgi:hypothetical protein